MVADGGDLIFDALCTNSDSDLSPHESSEEEPFEGKENKDRLAATPPPARRAK
jgi:hypothetical protein